MSRCAVLCPYRTIFAWLSNYVSFKRKPVSTGTRPLTPPTWGTAHRSDFQSTLFQISNHLIQSCNKTMQILPGECMKFTRTAPPDIAAYTFPALHIPGLLHGANPVTPALVVGLERRGRHGTCLTRASISVSHPRYHIRTIHAAYTMVACTARWVHAYMSKCDVDTAQ
jgi:hypothetical protein